MESPNIDQPYVEESKLQLTPLSEYTKMHNYLKQRTIRFLKRRKIMQKVKFNFFLQIKKDSDFQFKFKNLYTNKYYVYFFTILRMITSLTVVYYINYIHGYIGYLQFFMMMWINAYYFLGKINLMSFQIID